jgi:hypothetical protein
MNTAFNTALAAHGVSLITHIGLFNSGGTEISGGSYARQAVTWTGSGATRNLAADETFNIPAGAQLQEWRGFTALTGGTDYGGAVLDTPSGVYGNAGTFVLQAASTSITVQAGA